MRGMSPFSLGRQQGGRCQASVTSSPKEEERRQRGAAVMTVEVALSAAPPAALAEDARQRLGRSGRGTGNEKAARGGGSASF